MSDVPPFLTAYQARLVAELERWTPPDTEPPVLVHQAMRYTLLAPAKRVRGTLAVLAAELFGPGGVALPAAASVEMVHAASLILDDLPAMDDAPLRRGRPANHVQFGEAVAILAAVGLLNLAFHTLVLAYEAAKAQALARTLAEAVGGAGLIGGQVEDLFAPPHERDWPTVERIHRLKTAKLFKAAATAGALATGATAERIAPVSQYGEQVGLAFQIVDDLLDAAADRAAATPAPRRVARQSALLVLGEAAEARRRARALCDAACLALGPFGARADRLRALARYVAEREA